MNYNSKYLNPLVIFAFKKMFAEEANKDMLIAFLNEVLPERRQVVSLLYQDNQHIADMLNRGEFLLDMLCTDEQGINFYVELQLGRHHNFEERAIFHASRLIREQSVVSTAVQEPQQLLEVYVIALLEDCIERMPSDQYHHHIHLGNAGKGKPEIDGFNIVFVELPKFVKSGAELETALDKWLYTFKHMGKMDKLPVTMQEAVFEKLFGIAEYSQLSGEDKAAYLSDLRYKSAYDVVVELELKRKRKKNAKDEFLVFRCIQLSGNTRGRVTHEVIIGPLFPKHKH